MSADEFQAFLEETSSHLPNRSGMISEDHSWCPPSGHIHVLSTVITKSLYKLNVHPLGVSMGPFTGERSWSAFKLGIKICCFLVRLQVCSNYVILSYNTSLHCCTLPGRASWQTEHPNQQLKLIFVSLLFLILTRKNMQSGQMSNFISPMI